MECSSCKVISPIFDQGTVLVLSSNKQEQLNYGSKDELLELLLELHMSEVDCSIQISGRSDHYGMQTEALPLAQYISRLQHMDLLELIREKRFTSHIQPIIAAHTQTLYAYEFLLRPLPGDKPFQPYKLFEVARDCGMHSFLDRQARISAIETSARSVPFGIKRFINFLPSSIYNPNFCLNHTFKAIEKHRLDPADFVFEVVETEKIQDINHLKKVFDVYRDNGVKVALDDVGGGYSTPHVVRELKPDYIKIDRTFIHHCDQDAEKQRAIEAIIAIARDYGGIVLAEGIEHPEEWSYLQAVGISLGQGYFFGKPEPAIPLS